MDNDVEAVSHRWRIDTSIIQMYGVIISLCLHETQTHMIINTFHNKLPCKDIFYTSLVIIVIYFQIQISYYMQYDEYDYS